MTRDQVVEKLGQPYHGWRGHDPDEHDKRSGRAHCKYTDGKTDVHLVFEDGNLIQVHRNDLDTLPQISQIFAGVFQSYYLRLAIFFGCVGIFVNLFRGEMLDKSLHFYLLDAHPPRGPAGGQVCGRVAGHRGHLHHQHGPAMAGPASGGSDRAAVAGYLAGTGWGQLSSYLAVTALACVGYGSVFLAVGLLFRNPIIPTAVVLVWEGINAFLPAALKKISMIYYLQSLCPVGVIPDQDVPPLVRLLISPVQPATRPTAVSVHRTPDVRSPRDRRPPVAENGDQLQHGLTPCPVQRKTPCLSVDSADRPVVWPACNVPGGTVAIKEAAALPGLRSEPTSTTVMHPRFARVLTTHGV